MIVSSAAQAVLALNLLSGRKVPPWALRSLVRAAVDTAAQRGRTVPSGGEGFVTDGARDFAASLPNRFAKQVSYAAREVPFYRDRLGPQGALDRAVIPGLDVVPVTTREDLAAAGERMVARSAHPVVAHASTGTTGDPVKVWFSAAELELLAGISVLSDLERDGVRAADVIALCTAPGIARSTATRAAELVGAIAMPLDLLSPQELVGRLATPVELPGHAPRPTVVVASASLLAEALVAAERARLQPADFGIRSVVFGGEVACAEEIAARSARVFGEDVVVGESYGTTEVAPVSGVRCEGGHLHFAPAAGLVEVRALGKDRWAGHGELGTLVITPLAPFRSTTPLLRYDTGDVVEQLDQDRLTCSLSALTATSALLGKVKHLVVVGGRPLDPRSIVGALATVPGIPFPARYAVCGDPAPALAVVAEAARSPAAAAGAEAALRSSGFPAVAVTCVPGSAELRAWHLERGGVLVPLRADQPC